MTPKEEENLVGLLEARVPSLEYWNFRHANPYSSYSLWATGLKFLHNPHQTDGKSAKCGIFEILPVEFLKDIFVLKNRCFRYSAAIKY